MTISDPNAIQWDDEQPPDDAIHWDDESPNFANVSSGKSTTAPNVLSFGQVNAPRGTLPGLQDFSPEGMALDPGTAESVAQGAKDIAGELESGVKGAAENYQYPQELDANGQPKRRVGLFEAFGRRAASGFEDLADLAGKFDPASAGTRIAASVTGQPTAFAGEAEATRVNPEKEQYEGAREELAGNLGADLLTNFAPFERLGSAASKLMKAPWLKTPAKEAALVGEFGPGPQGAATADEIVDQALDHAAKSSAGDIAVTPEMRAPAEESRAVVPDAAMDASAAPGPGPAELPTGEPVPEQAAPAERAPGGPDLGVAEAQPTTVQPASVGEAGRDAPLFNSSSSPAAASESVSEPLYHASLADFDAFKEGTEGTASDPGVFGRGHYVTGDERLAPMYLGPRKAEGTLYTIENRMQNPRVFDSPSEAIDWQGERGTDSPEAAERVRQKYLDAGHDGAIIRNPKTGRTMEAVAFDPEALRVAGKRRLGEPQPEPIAERAPESAIAEPKSAITDTTDVYALELGKLQDEIGWQERGGRMIRRDEGGESAGGLAPVAGRTQWVAKSDFWPAYRARDPNPLSESEASRALEKMASGEKLTKREERFGDFAKETASERAGTYGEAVTEHHELARQDYERGARASIRDAQRAAEEEGSTHAEAVRGDQGQTRSAGRAGSRGENQRGENLQLAGQEKRAAFAQRVPETRAVEGADAPEAPGLASGISNARVNADRAERGLEEVAHNLGRSDPESVARVRQRFDENPNYGADLARSFVERPRAATKEEGIALALDRSRIKNARRDAYERAEKAQDAGDTAALETARKETDRLDAELEQNDIAAKHTGHEWAEAGRARQMLMREDYTMAEMVRRQKVKKGGALTEKERAAVEARAKDIEAREAALAKREAELTAKAKRPDSPFRQRDASKRFDALVEEMKKTSRKTLCEVA